MQKFTLYLNLHRNEGKYGPEKTRNSETFHAVILITIYLDLIFRLITVHCNQYCPLFCNFPLKDIVKRYKFQKRNKVFVGLV